MSEQNEQNEEEIRRSPLDSVRQWMYYFIIGIISFVALVFLPMLGTSVGLGWAIPDTAAGWTVWIVMKLIVATLNVLIFYSFMQQGKLNVKDDPNYIKAQSILVKVRVKNVQPRSPAKWNGQQYGKKGVTIFLSTGLATVAFTNAVLAFNLVDLLTYLFAIVMGIIFGILQMKNAEEYWREEYLRYAYMKKDEWEKEEERARGYAQAIRNIAAGDVRRPMGASGTWQEPQLPENDHGPGAIREVYCEEIVGRISGTEKLKEEKEDAEDRG